MMKAIVCPRYGAPEVLVQVEMEKPPPKDHEVLIKIHATTVTVADTRIRAFKIPPSFVIPAAFILGFRRPKKAVLGVELAGEIEAIGKEVTLFKKGDQVFAATLFGFGAYAEYKCLPETATIAIKPTNCTFEEAAALPVGARTALHYLRKAGVDAQSVQGVQKKKILVYGASGSVGTYAVQLAKYFGAEVTAVCGSTNLALVKSIGADKVIDYTATDFVKQLETYDVIFVAIDKIPFSICNQLLDKNGTYLNVTKPLKSVHMMWTSLVSRKKIIVGQNPSEKAEDLIFLKELVEKGVLKPVIDRIYPFEQMVDAHRYVDQGHKKGNVVVTL